VVSWQDAGLQNRLRPTPPQRAKMRPARVTAATISPNLVLGMEPPTEKTRRAITVRFASRWRRRSKPRPLFLQPQLRRPWFQQHLPPAPALSAFPSSRKRLHIVLRFPSTSPAARCCSEISHDPLNVPSERCVPSAADRVILRHESQSRRYCEAP